MVARRSDTERPRASARSQGPRARLELGTLPVAAMLSHLPRARRNGSTFPGQPLPAADQPSLCDFPWRTVERNPDRRCVPDTRRSTLGSRLRCPFGFTRRCHSRSLPLALGLAVSRPPPSAGSCEERATPSCAAPRKRNLATGTRRPIARCVSARVRQHDHNLRNPPADTAVVIQPRAVGLASDPPFRVCSAAR
jgi:hypothetical protein